MIEFKVFMLLCAAVLIALCAINLAIEHYEKKNDPDIDTYRALLDGVNDAREAESMEGKKDV